MKEFVVRIESEADLVHQFRECLHILNNLRHSTKNYEEVLGYKPKMKKKEWEDKADAFLNNLGANLHPPQVVIKKP